MICILLIAFLPRAAPARSGTTKPPDRTPVVVGAFGALTGSESSFGTAQQRGIEVAVDEINRCGGSIDGRTLQFVFEDDKGTAEGAALAVSKLVKEHHVVAVVGEISSSRSLAAAPICQRAGVPMISPGSTHEKLTKVGDYIFRACFVDRVQGEAMASFAATGLKARRIAILKDRMSDYSATATSGFISAFEALGGSVAVVEYRQGDADFGGQIRKIKGLKVDAIFVPGYYAEVALIARQARANRLEIPILAGDGSATPSFIEIGGTALRNTYVADHFAADGPWPAAHAFAVAYKERFGVEPGAVAALSYDATKLLADALWRAQSTAGDRLRDAIAGTKHFESVTGPMSFDGDRNATRAVVIMKLEFVKGKYRFAFAATVPSLAKGATSAGFDESPL